MSSPEELAREKIDKLLADCGWILQNRSTINLSASRGIAIREALLKERDEVDYLLFVDGKAIGTVEAKPESFTLTGVEEQSRKYGKNLLDIYGKWRDPLPFAYESTGIEIQFTSQIDPSPKSRNVFAFHRPETLVEYLGSAGASPAGFIFIAELAPTRPFDHRSDANDESLVRANRSHPQPRKIPGRQQTPRPHPDGHWERHEPRGSAAKSGIGASFQTIRDSN
jgi:hypothetical protein